jgi:hypothetical protein
VRFVPFLFVLICPLMMFGMMFMHRLGRHGARGSNATSDPAPDHGHPTDESVDDLLDSRDDLRSRLEALDARISTFEREETSWKSKAQIGA